MNAARPSMTFRRTRPGSPATPALRSEQLLSPRRLPARRLSPGGAVVPYLHVQLPAGEAACPSKNTRKLQLFCAMIRSQRRNGRCFRGPGTPPCARRVGVPREGVLNDLDATLVPVLLPPPTNTPLPHDGHPELARTSQDLTEDAPAARGRGDAMHATPCACEIAVWRWPVRSRRRHTGTAITIGSRVLPAPPIGGPISQVSVSISYPDMLELALLHWYLCK